MNKHAIILPMLITSAVSLHVLSFYLEDPLEQIVDVPTPITSPVDPTQVVVSPNPEESSSVNVNVSADPSSTEVKVAVKETSNTQVVQSVTPSAQATPVVNTPQSTPTPNPDSGVKLAAALLPTKSYDDMVREAKQIGGRVDPFLSMKPPEIEKIPEIPEPVATPFIQGSTTTKVSNDGNISQNIKNIRKTGKIPKPPSAWIPDFNKPNKTLDRLVIIPKNNSGKTTTVIVPKVDPKTGKVINTTVTTTTNSNQTSVVIVPESQIAHGLELTGIITGNRPFALIKVDSESKIFKIGDVIRKEGRIKLVSIDFENETITLSNSLNKRTRLSIK